MVQQSLAASVPVIKPALNLAATSGRVFEALNPDVTIPKWTWASVTIPPRIKDQLEERFVRGDGLPGDRCADVRAAERPLERAVPAEHPADRTRQHHAARDESEVHRGVHGRGSTTSSRASCCGANIPPISAAATSASSGTRSGFLVEGGATPEALRERLRDIRRATHVEADSRRSGITTTARRTATRKRRWCSSSAASCSRAIRMP